MLFLRRQLLRTLPFAFGSSFILGRNQLAIAAQTAGFWAVFTFSDTALIKWKACVANFPELRSGFRFDNDSPRTSPFACLKAACGSHSRSTISP
jgi:hypothetical protein